MGSMCCKASLLFLMTREQEREAFGAPRNRLPPNGSDCRGEMADAASESRRPAARRLSEDGR